MAQDLDIAALRRRANELASHAENGNRNIPSAVLDTAACEAGYSGWPDVHFIHEDQCMERDEKVQRLKTALFYGQHWVTRRLLQADPDLGNHDLALELALYDVESVRRRLAQDPGCATRSLGERRPILHLAFSQHIHAAPEREEAMLAIADELVRHGADVNDGWPAEPGSPHMLSALYGASGHSDNLALTRWLLDHGADPNDQESLYHSTELDHCATTRLLIESGAQIDGTNALLRAIDFNDHETVLLFLENGASVGAVFTEHPSGQPVPAVPALHHAARRMADARMAGILIEAGAGLNQRHHGHLPYAFARIYGNHGVARTIEEYGGPTRLTKSEQALVALADGSQVARQTFSDVELSEAATCILTDIAAFPDKLNHAKRLVEFGFDHDSCDDMQLTSLHVAGWEGLTETVDWLLSRGARLDHVNGFGGDLLSTIIHGSENCPNRLQRDHAGCARLALEAGLRIGANTISYAGNQEMAEFLVRWTCDHPEQLVEGGPR